MELAAAEREMLTELQKGIPIEARPFSGYSMPEADVVALLVRAQHSGLVRRFGGVFDSHRLGYKSMLCAVKVQEFALAQTAATICKHPGVTHCYERRAITGAHTYPLLWFTIAMPEDAFDAGMERLQSQMPAEKILALPALQRFKIDVVFDLRHAGADGGTASSSFGRQGDDLESVLLTEQERRLVRLLGGDFAVAEQPFCEMAEQIEMAVPDLLDTLRRWKELGVLRRIAPVLYHRVAGFTANGMCVWPVSGDVGTFGQQVAARPAVTHCYQRTRVPEFPFDLYAMIHAGSTEALHGMFGEITASCGLQGGILLRSGQVFKKSSMQYFA